MDKKYFIGVDLGTDSCGWAVTDMEYNIKKFKGNSMWGIRLFDESQTAEERRGFRTARRRLHRRSDRLAWLEMIFAEEINKIDPSFFIRLKESGLHFDDKTSSDKYVLFNGAYNDKDFYKKYPTIYSLRRELIENSNPHDVRLVFLALHHLIKYRGHFLFEDLSIKEISNFKSIFEALTRYCIDNCSELDFTSQNIDEIEEVIKNRSISKTAKKDKLAEIYNITKKSHAQLFACLGLISGRKEKLQDVFNDESFKESEIKDISFSEKYSENEEVYSAALGERFELIEKLKAIYDCGVLADIRQDEQFISIAMDKRYYKHRDDLKKLKKYVKTYHSKEEYDEIFKVSKEKICNYVAYSGHSKKNGKTAVLNESASQEEFCAYLKKVLGECKNSAYAEMFNEILTGTFCPKQRSADNGVIPMQLHRIELEKILNNAEKYLPFLNIADAHGVTAKQKIIDIFDYKIPYYVGSLNNHSEKYWIKRSAEKIYPWNIKDIVDFDACAEAFIDNLTNKCTYLPQYDVVAKNTILYSRYAVLNEINPIKIDGEPISVELKQEIFNELFLKRNKVSRTAVYNFLKSKNIAYTTVTGIDEEIKSSMKSYRDFERFTNLTDNEKDEIIKAITVFGQEKRMLKKRLLDKYGDKLDDKDIGYIAKLNYSGWGRLSKEFLTEVKSVDKSTGELLNIISALWQDNMNLMQLMYSEKYDFTDAVSQANTGEANASIRKAVEQLYVSPKIKRPIYQSLLIIKELVKTQGCPPEKIFLEVARYEGDKKRTKSRKSQLEELYSACKKDYPEVWAELNDIKEDEKLKSDKLFLYFVQLGRCMYTGEKIDLHELMSENSRWDIDHIYPRSKIKDDSIHNNRVLANKTYNNKTKGSKYPLPASTQSEMAAFWKYLLDKKLINAEKYNRLICRTPLTDEQLSAFINRQLVKTQQSTKAIAEILKAIYPKTEIVYVKAGLVSDFRQKYELIKSRDVNDLHHAKDAYLNIVVGNVYNVQCTHNRANFIKGLQSDERDSYSLNGMFNFDIKGAWNKQTSIATVKKFMAKNNILYTRYSFKQKGSLFDQQLVKKGLGQVPIKSNGALRDSSKYGRYNRPTACYFCFAEFNEPRKDVKVRGILPIDLYQEKIYSLQPERYIAENYGVENVKILIPCIKYNSCLEFNGFRTHLSSKSGGGKQLVYKPAVQLVLSQENEAYIKLISNYLTKNSGRKINAYDKLSAEKNIAVYDAILRKLTETIFSKNFDAVRKCVVQGRDKFVELPIEKQCAVIGELLKILHSNVMSGDLEAIGGAKKSGIVTTSSKISAIKSIESVKLINQSITGLYEHEVDLLNM